MYRKSNPIIAATINIKEEMHAPFSHTWQFYQQIDENFYIFFRQRNGQTIFAPMYFFSFCFRPFRQTESERFLRQHPDPEQLTTTADKLRYYRYKKSLLQREVADYAEIDRSTYIHYENGMDAYPLDKLVKIAELFEVDITDLLDEYNRFLYDGQGKQIRNIRKNMNLTQYEFGKLLDVSSSAVKRWESNIITISKRKLILLNKII